MPLSTTSPHQNILIDGQNPFWLLDAANAMFDQSTLHESERTFPLLPFQRAMLILAGMYRFTKFQAPSQSGKSLGMALIAATCLYAFPGQRVLLLSTNDEQSKRILTDVKDRFISCHKVPALRELDIDSVSDGELRVAATRSRLKAVPHSIKAITGNPCQVVILDELSKYDKQPNTIYAEAVARVGKTGGIVVCASTFLGEGKRDPNSPTGYTGNFYHYLFKTAFEQRRDPNKHDFAASFTYHVSPFLRKNIDAIKAQLKALGKGDEYFKEHYLGQPRKLAGEAVFSNDFSYNDHVKKDEELELNPNYPLFVCFDPGLNKACVVGQLDMDLMRLTYIRAYKGTREITFPLFVQKCWTKIQRTFPGFSLEVYADVAARKQDDFTGTTAVEEISYVTNQWPITEYQKIAPGIQIMRSFMHRRGGFQISDHPDCLWLLEAISTGLVYSERKVGEPKEEWLKDGDYEHVGDAARYPVHYLMNGSPVFPTFGAELSVVAIPKTNVNPYTGY
jgi:hypothetical protein